MPQRPIGRPRRFAKYEQWFRSLEKPMAKRPKYLDGVGAYVGTKSTTMWVKILAPHGALFKGKSYPPGKAIEIKLGNFSSWDWLQVEAERDRLQGLADRGEPLEDATRVLFADAAHEWYERRKDSVRGAGTLKGHVYSSLIPAFGSKHLNDITVRDVNLWQANEAKTNNSKPSTIKRKRNTLSAILNLAVKEGRLTENPVKNATKLDIGTPRLRIPSNDEVNQILARAKEIENEQQATGEKDKRVIRTEPWLADLIKWSILSGMRRAESLRVRLSDVETLEDGRLVIRVSKTKSQQPRLVSCSAGMAEIIEKVRQYDRAGKDDRLFAISIDRASKMLTHLWKTCGVEDIRLHDLRRLHASTLMRVGVDTKTVASRIGHSSFAMLEKHYAVFMGDQEAADKAQTAFDNVVSEGN